MCLCRPDTAGRRSCHHGREDPDDLEGEKGIGVKRLCSDLTNLRFLQAAHVEVEPFWPSLFAKALEGVDVKNLISNLSSGVGAAPAAGGTKFLRLTPS